MQFWTYTKKEKVASPHFHEILKLIYILLQFSFMLTDLCFPTNLDFCSCEVYHCFVGTYFQLTWCYCVMCPILPFSLRAMFSRSICVAICTHLLLASNCHLHSRVGSNPFIHPFFQGHSHCLPPWGGTVMPRTCPLMDPCEGFFGVYRETQHWQSWFPETLTGCLRSPSMIWKGRTTFSLPWASSGLQITPASSV